MIAWTTRQDAGLDRLDTDGVHFLMGVSMTGMLAPRLNPIPIGWWEAVFALAAAWFAARTIRIRHGSAATAWRCPHPLPHLVESGAMLAMLLAAQNPAHGTTDQGMAMPGMGAGPAPRQFPVLGLFLAMFMVGYVVWLGYRLTLPSPAPVGATGHDTVAHATPHAPRLAACYKIAMGITMVYVLITML